MKRTILLIALVIVASGCREAAHDHEQEAAHDHEQEAAHDHEQEADDDHEQEADDDHADESVQIPETIAAAIIDEHAVEAGVTHLDLELACEVETAPEATVHILSLVDGRVQALHVTTGTSVASGALLGTVISADLVALRLRHDVAHGHAVLARQRLEQVQAVHENLENLVIAADPLGGVLLPDALPDLVAGAWKGRLLSARNRQVTAQVDADRVRATAADLRALAGGLSDGVWTRPKDTLQAGELGAKLLEAEANRRHAWTVFTREKELAAGGLAPERRMDGARRDLTVARTTLEGLIQQARIDAAAMEARSGEDLATAAASFRSVVEEIALEMKTHQLEEAKLEAEAAAALEVTHRRLADYGVDPDAIAVSCAPGNSKGSSCWEIRAPAGGVVLGQNVAAGQSVEAGSLLYTIADPSRLWIQCDVYDRDLARLSEARLPLDADVRSRAWPGQVTAGSLDYLAATTDPVTRTTRARVRVTDPDSHLRPGSFVRATVHIPVDSTLLEVPRRSLVRAGGDDAVFVKTDSGSWLRRGVLVSAVVRDRAWIREGLTPGEVIAARGAHTLDAEQRWSDVGGACSAHGHAH